MGINDLLGVILCLSSIKEGIYWMILDEKINDDKK
jgi:hypothetical protein